VVEVALTEPKSYKNLFKDSSSLLLRLPSINFFISSSYFSLESSPRSRLAVKSSSSLEIFSKIGFTFLFNSCPKA